jgi:uncharacterized protein YndB with AHSA1/START domain
MRTQHITVEIAAPFEAIMDYVSDARHIPEWAPGLGHSVHASGDHWVVDTAQGPVQVRFAPPNVDGILDHTVTLPDGISLTMPLRLQRQGASCMLTFTLHQHAGMSDTQFAHDAELVQQDLNRLKHLMEG